ncbi:MAG: EthD domain-containing protein [Erythrobacter sp.]|nr:EthD domain-containing protein [Erythrobacter sp.]
MRSLCTLVHKPGFGRAAFQHYYEQHHAPLACTLFPFAAYRRNHVLEGPDLGFDTISEFEAADLAVIGQVLAGEAGPIIAADEARFLDAARNRPAGAQQHVLSAGDRADAAGLRTAVLVQGEGAAAAALACARDLAQGHAGVSVDLLTAWSEPAFPAQAVIWLEGRADIPALTGGLTGTTLILRHCATPDSELVASQCR